MTIDRLVRLWYRPSRLIYGLAPLGFAFRCASRVRRELYRWGLLTRTRLAVPVVVIGNITAGGTGKTPLTVWLANRLAASGITPGVVCRSYAASASSPGAVAPDDDPGIRGDEAVLLASRLSCPVWSGPDRVATARALLAAEARVDVIVCDDGLQHYALERDAEIALVDARRGFGNGLSLPAGPLREPRSRLRTVDAVVLNGDGEVAGLPPRVPRFRMRLEGNLFRNLVDGSRTAMPEEFSGKRVAAVAGIGDPQRFFDHLRSLGLAFDPHPFPDHHQYRACDLAMKDADVVLLTEKDAIKCARFRDPRMWALGVSAEVSGDLLTLILGRIGAKAQATRPPAHAA